MLSAGSDLACSVLSDPERQAMAAKSNRIWNFIGLFQCAIIRNYGNVWQLTNPACILPYDCVMNTTKIICWLARLVAAVIMLQTLYFKFIGAPESVEIFTTVGVEPWGRYAVGVLELIASLLLLINTTAWAGGALALMLMSGAIGMHLTLLGIEVQDDGGLLFFLALLVAASSIIVLVINKEQIMLILKNLRAS